MYAPKKGVRKTMPVEDKGSLSCIYEKGLYAHKAEKKRIF